MKKIVMILFSIVLIASLTACSSSEAYTDGKTIMKFGHGSAVDNARHQAALKFKTLVEEKTSGEIEVQVFPNEQLGSEPEMVESVAMGNLQATAAGTGIFAQYHKQIGVVELPYLFADFEQAWSVLDGPIGTEISEPLREKGIHIIGYWENGFRHVTNDVRPIQRPSDLKGIKIRTPEIPVSISILQEMGANPTPMPFGELYLSLQQGVVDGQENPLTNIYASKFYEVQKYLSLTGHQYSPLPVAVSEEFWQSLSPDQQAAVEEAAQEAGQYHRDVVREDDRKLKAELQQKGMKVNEVDTGLFRTAAAPIYREYEQVYGTALVEKVLQVSHHSRQ